MSVGTLFTSQCFSFLPSKISLIIPISWGFKGGHLNEPKAEQLWLAHSGHTGNGCYVSGSYYEPPPPPPGIQHMTGKGLGSEDFQGRKADTDAGIWVVSFLGSTDS